MGHVHVGTDEAYFPERSIVTRGPAGSGAISITAVVAEAKNMVIKQSMRAVTVSFGMSRRTRGGDGASGLQAVKSFLLKVGPWQGQPTIELQHKRKNIEFRKQ